MPLKNLKFKQMYFKTDEYHFKIEVLFRPLVIYQKIQLS